MGVEESEWTSIRNLVSRMFSNTADSFITTKVTKVDSSKKLVYAKEFGIQPIPLVNFGIEVTYYDSVWNPGASRNDTVKKTAKVSMVMPSKGDTILVARELGKHRLPRCLGVLIGTGWIIAGDANEGPN